MKIGEYKQAMSHMLKKDNTLENFSFNPDAKLIDNDPIGYATGGRVGFANGSSPEIQERIIEQYSKRLPKGTKFDFKKNPVTGISRQDDIQLYNSIKSNLIRPSYLTQGVKQNVVESQKRKENSKQYIKDQIDKFENEKILPNETYKINKSQLRKDLKIDPTTIDSILDELKKEGEYNFITPKTGETTTSSLTQDAIDIYKKNYDKKTVAQIASEITGKPYTNQTTKNIYGQLNRLQKSLIDEGSINQQDILRGTSIEPRPKATSGFKTYTEAQQRLMDLDPKTYGEFNSPADLDRELMKRLQFNKVSGALNLQNKKFPEGLRPSYEHIQGVTPSHIIQDPEGLSKVGIQTRRYNWDIMGKDVVNSPYKAVKNYLSTAKKSLSLGDSKTAEDALNVVNSIYDDVSDSYKGINREELPFYDIKKNRIVESNVNGVIKPKTLQKAFEQYFQNAAAVIEPGELNNLKKIQPNVANILNLYKNGEDAKASTLIKTRIPDVKRGELFMNMIPGQQAIGDFLSGVGTELKAGKILSPVLKVLNPIGYGLGAYSVGETFEEGKPLPEVASSFLGLDPLIQSYREQSRLTPEAKNIQKRLYEEQVRTGESYVPGLDSTFFDDNMKASTTEEEKNKLQQEQESIAEQLAKEEKLTSEERKPIVDYLKNRFSPFAKEEDSERQELAGGGEVGMGIELFKKLRLLGRSLAEIKNNLFHMSTAEKYEGKDKAINWATKNWIGLDKSPKDDVFTKIEETKKYLPKEYHSTLDDIKNSVESTDYTDAKNTIDAFIKTMHPDLKFENLPLSHFPMEDPLNDAFIILNPKDRTSYGRYRTSYKLDEDTGRGMRVTYDTWDPEKKEFLSPKEWKIQGAEDLEKGKEGLN